VRLISPQRNRSLRSNQTSSSLQISSSLRDIAFVLAEITREINVPLPSPPTRRGKNREYCYESSYSTDRRQWHRIAVKYLAVPSCLMRSYRVDESRYSPRMPIDPSVKTKLRDHRVAFYERSSPAVPNNPIIGDKLSTQIAFVSRINKYDGNVYIEITRRFAYHRAIHLFNIRGGLASLGDLCRSSTPRFVISEYNDVCLSHTDRSCSQPTARAIRMTVRPPSLTKSECVVRATRESVNSSLAYSRQTAACPHDRPKFGSSARFPSSIRVSCQGKTSTCPAHETFLAV
jgi:hypothetical protein